MADEDKLINVVVKYSQLNSDEVASTSAKSKFAVLSDVQGMKEAFSKLSTEQIKGWEAVGTSSKTTLDKMKADFNKLTEDQLKNFAKLKPAMGVISEGKSPGAPGGPLDPEIPKRFNQALVQTNEEFQGLRQTAQQVGQIGNMLAITGAAITGPLMLSANSYVKTLGVITDESAEWVGHTEAIKRSNLEIGQVATQAMLPAMKLSAEFMERIAFVVQQHPWLIQGAAVAGGAMAVIGAGTRIISEVLRVVSSMSGLMARLEASQIRQAAMLAANSAGGVGSSEYLPGGAGSLAGSQAKALGTLGTITLMAGSVILGAEIGSIIGNAIAKLIYGEDYKRQTVGDAFMTAVKMNEIALLTFVNVLAKANPALTDFANGVIAFVNKVNNTLGGIVGSSEVETQDQSQIVSQQAVQAFMTFQSALLSAEESYGQQRSDIIEQTEKQIADLTERYEAQRVETVRNFGQQMAQSMASFARQQSRALEEFELASTQANKVFRETEQRAEEEFRKSEIQSRQAHQQDLQRLEQQHNARKGDLAAARDALGLVKENQAYAQAREEKNQDFQISQRQRRQEFQQQQAERRADFILQQAEAKANFDRQREIAQEDHARQLVEQRRQFSQRLAQLDSNHKAETQKLEEQEKEKLRKLTESYQKQVQLIQTAFVDRLRALDAAILGDTKAFNEHMKAQALAFQKWLDAFKKDITPGTFAGSHQYGGYATFSGPGETGRPEFVLSGSTTQLAESFMGTRLNQANLLSSLMGSSSGGKSNRTLQVTVQSRNLTMSEIRTQIDSALTQRLGELLPGV